MSDPVRVADRYEVIRTLGQGSFGQTLLARDLKLMRQVALKVLRPRGGNDLKAYELFEREAAVLRDLHHPGVPVVHTALRAEWEGAEAAFLVMEYIEGPSLAELIADRRHLDPDDVRGLFAQLLDVLDHLHSRVPPVLHRDIKPANVIVRPGGRPALVDFGAVRSVFRAPSEAGSTVVGTYGYMPYEQYMGQASPSSDLYALAATFLHLVTGRPPADFMTEAGRIEVPQPLPCGEPLRGVLARLLLPAPAERLRSAADARALLSPSSLQPAPAGTLAPATLPPAPRRLDRDTRRWLRRVAYSPWKLMSPDVHPDDGLTVVDGVLIAFFSVLTAGILPALFVGRWVNRRRRLKTFFLHGLPATAQVLELEVEKIEFDAKLTRVRYEFRADDRRHVGTDRVHPAVAERWETGMEVRILYLPERNYDSVIVHT